MIHDVDESVREFVRRDALDGSNVEISFEAPNKDWACRRPGPALNAYLSDIQEDLERRRVQFEEMVRRPATLQLPPTGLIASCASVLVGRVGKRT